MKKKVKLLAVLTVVGASVWGMYKTYVQKVDTSNLLLTNIEVFAGGGESDDGRIDNAMEHTFQCGAPINGSACTTTVISCPGGGIGCTPRKCPYHG
jgi:hypothetical protein